MTTKTTQKKPAQKKPLSHFALAVRRLRRTIGRGKTPGQKMLHALNGSGKTIYQGTANPKAVAKRRAKNKMARHSRAINRGR